MRSYHFSPIFFSPSICYDKNMNSVFMDPISLIIIYLLAVNVVSFAAMGIDKQKARKHAWRIPESTLFVLAIIGGSIGSILGMRLFRHKTRHRSFVYGMPAILIVQIILILLLVFSPIEFLIM